MPEWYEEWFGDEYLELYPHRDNVDAERAVSLILDAVPFESDWRVLDVACGPGRHAGAFRKAGARYFGLDLSASLLRVARSVTDAPLIRADKRYLPVRPGAMDLTVNLFTSFGYFDRDEEHVMALGEMVSTLRPGGWFVIDLMNPSSVRAALVPREVVRAGAADVLVTRSISPDNRYVCKTIERAGGRRFVERVRLFEPAEIGGMLERAGVAIRHRFGDYDAAPHTPESARTILVGQTA